MANERIDLFLETQNNIIVHNSSNNIKKITTEISKLCTWIQKHQNELLTDTSKGKLLFIIEKYYTYLKNIKENEHERSKLVEAVEKLLSDFLSLPEGRLCSSKNKQKVMSWQSQMTSSTSTSSSLTNNTNNIERWIICDACDNKITLMKHQSDSEEIIEDVIVTNTVFLAKINSIYGDGDSEKFAQIDYDRNNNMIIKIYDEEGNEIMT